jgi:intein/homing endonuclease
MNNTTTGTFDIKSFGDNFGWVNDPFAVKAVVNRLEKKDVYAAAPHLEGYGENKRGEVYLSYKKLFGKHMPAQSQPRGTCVSRGWSRVMDYLQCVKILNGDNWKFNFVSHSYVYGTSRMIGNWLSYEDGSVGAWAAEAAVKFGQCTRDEVGDPLKNDDSIAVEWGAKGVPQKYRDLGSDNLAKAFTAVKNAEQARDVLTANFPIAVCSNQGFTMTRDNKGRCTPSGTWNHCYLAGTVISGSKMQYIQDINIGDKVYSHDGTLNTVTNIDSHKYTGDLYTIKAIGNKLTTVTEEHPILIFRSELESVHIQPKGGLATVTKPSTICWKKLKMKWVKACDLRIGDIVVTPRLKPISIAIPDWSKTKGKYPNKLDKLDSDILWLFGLFIGDGNVVNNHKITFTLANKKQIDKVVDVVKNKLGLETKVYTKANYSRVTVYNASLARSFKEWFYDNGEKIIPDFIFNTFSKDLIDGLLDSDGTRRGNESIFYNTSKKLILQVYHTLVNLGYFPGIYTRNVYKGCFDNYKTGYYISVRDSKENQKKKYIDGFLSMPITEIDKEYVEDKTVYNLEVGNTHNYIAEGISSHNCMMWSGFDPDLNRFLVEQSWDQNTPSGPLYLDQPDNSFWIDWDVADYMLRQDDSFVITDNVFWLPKNITYYI